MRESGFLRTLLLPITILLSVLTIPADLHATIVERLTLEQLAARAQSIVAGRVRRSETHWSSDGRLILTTHTIEVEEAIKGAPAQTIEVTTVGGRIGNMALYVAGMPAFEAGERAIIFLERSGGYATVLGLGQGKFTWSNGIVENAVAGLSFSDGLPASPLRMSAEAFKQQVHSILDRQP